MQKKLFLLLSITVLSFNPLTSFAKDNNPEVINNRAEEIVSDKDLKTLEILDAWARPSMTSNGNSSAYMKINNPTDKDYTIIGASASDIANNVELHETFTDDQGISRMSILHTITVPAGTEIELKPGAQHIMLMNLKASLKPGDEFDIIIYIKGSDLLPVKVTVKE